MQENGGGSIKQLAAFDFREVEGDQKGDQHNRRRRPKSSLNRGVVNVLRRGRAVKQKSGKRGSDGSRQTCRRLENPQSFALCRVVRFF